MLFVLGLFADLLREVLTFLVMSVRPKTSLAAENLFPRRELINDPSLHDLPYKIELNQEEGAKKIYTSDGERKTSSFDV